MALDFRVNRWGLIGFVGVVSLTAALPWLADRVADPQTRLILIAPILAAFAGACALMFARQPEAPNSVIRSEMPVAVAVQRPWWALFVHLVATAIAGLAWADVVSDTIFRLALFGSLMVAAWLESYWRQNSEATLT